MVNGPTLKLRLKLFEINASAGGDFSLGYFSLNSIPPKRLRPKVLSFQSAVRHFWKLDVGHGTSHNCDFFLTIALGIETNSLKMAKI